MYKFEKFSEVKVLVIGDVMIDRYLSGDVSRISPEAPVPVVRLKNTKLIAGGAANVAANIAGLGATPYLIGIIGNDYEGGLFPKILDESNVSAKYLHEIPDRQTTIKTRIVAHNQQIARIDQETTEKLSREIEEEVFNKIAELIDEVHVIVISDYNKGLLSENITSRLITASLKKSKIILADPKGKDYSKYKRATIITPNKLEAAEISGIELNSESALKEAGSYLLKELELKALLITRGEEGMTLFEPNSTSHLKAFARDVYDVIGAGDTVIASLAVAIGAGESFFEAAKIANAAAGLVVRELGTTSIKIEKLKKALSGIVE